MEKKRTQKIIETLKTSFEPTVLEVQDDSHKHHGHDGTQDGKGHFTVYIESKTFTGLSRVAAHRLIYDALADLLKTDIHAVAIHTRVPE